MYLDDLQYKKSKRLKIRFLSKTMGERRLNPYKKLYKILFLTCNTIKISKYIQLWHDMWFKVKNNEC